MYKRPNIQRIKIQLWFNFQFSRIDRFGSWSYGIRFYIPFTYDANSIHKFLVKLKIKYWHFSGSRPQVWCCSSRFNSCILFTIAFSLHFYTNYLNKITSARSFCIFYLFEACKQYFKVFRKKKKKKLYDLLTKVSLFTWRTHSRNEQYIVVALVLEFIMLVAFCCEDENK